jgi:hypothetical protein
MRSHTSCRLFLPPDNKHHTKSHTTQHPYTTRHLTPRNSRHLTLAMSDPFLDPPKVATYRIDPNKQCGVIKPDGNRCTTKLSCTIHGEDEKHTVDRSKPYKTLLARQSRLLVPDTHHVARDADQASLAPIFDPDEHCGADLPTGQPCTQDILYCDAHVSKQQPTVPGRSVGFNNLERVDEANMSRLRWKSGDEPYQYSPDTDCGVMKSNGEPCQCTLSCLWHTQRAKLAVLRTPPFQNKFYTLLRLQKSRIPSSELDNSWWKTWSEPWWLKAAELRQDVEENHIVSGSGEGQQTLGGEGGVGGNGINARGDSPGPDALRRVEKANNSRKNQEGDHNRTPDQYNPDTDCGAMKTNGEHCQIMLVACGLHRVEVQRAVPRNPPFANNFSELYRLQLVHQLAELLGPGPSEPQENLQPHQSTQLMHSDQGMKERSIQHGLVANGVARSEVTDERVLDGSGYLQQALRGESGTGVDKTDLLEGSDDAPPSTPSQPPRGKVDTSSSNDTSTATSPKTPRGTASPLSLHTSDDEHFSPTAPSPEIPRGNMTSLSLDTSDNEQSIPSTPSPKTARGNASLSSLHTSDDEHFTPTAPSPKISRGDVSSLSLDTSDDEQFTPTSSRNSLYGRLSDDKHEQELKLEAWEAALIAREADLEQATAKLDDEAKNQQLLRDQTRKDPHKAQLYDQDIETRRNEQLIYEQHCESRRDEKLVYEQYCESRRNEKLVYEQHCESRRNEKLVYEKYCECRRNEKIIYDQHCESHRNEQLLRNQDKEKRHNAFVIYEQDKEQRLKAQLRYDQDRAELDRRVRAQQVSEDELARLRRRAQRADKLEETLDTQRSQKKSILQTLDSVRDCVHALEDVDALKSSERRSRVKRERSQFYTDRLQDQIDALFE